LDPHAAASLLDEFRKLPSRIERLQTFMEIGGYPHYENVCSNFLAFFFDPEGPHGLGSLFLDALLGSVSIADEKKNSGGSVSIDREITTEAGNRIDILVKSDSHAVLIENKIYAAAVNPFDDYTAYLNRLKKEDGTPYENKIKILLTLYPSGEGAEWHFVNLTHADFVSAVRSALGDHVLKADTRYLTLMLDFLNTLENLGEGTRMNQGYIKLLAERGDEVEKFLRGIQEVRGELRGKVQRLEALINVEGHQNVEQIPWSPNPNNFLKHFLQHRVHVDEKSYIVVESVISPSGWEIQIFYRGKVDSSKLENLPNELEIPAESNGSFIYNRFAYEEDLSRIAPVVQEIVDKISHELS
jgi:hypothetical protein